MANLMLRMIAVTLLCVAPTQAQDLDRVPSGDLSNFFNPPGVTATNLGTTTRSIGSGRKKKADPEPGKKVDPPAPGNSSTTPDLKSKPTDDSNAAEKMKKTPASLNPGGRVKLEDKEVGEIEGGVSFGPPTVTNWRVGAVMVTRDEAARGVVCRIPVPVQWPEQTVSVFEENLPTEISAVGWEDLGNIRLMKFRIDNVAPGSKLQATVTFQVSTSQIIAPKNTSVFRIPPKKTRDTKAYYGESPGISPRDSKLKKQAKALFDNSQSDWTKIEGMYDWVRDNIEERTGKAKGSVDTFRNKAGPGEDRVGVFVAMCRANKVPARMVFVDGSQYAEFYMVDEKEQGHWFPCQVTGIREFGSIGEPRVILQKGDNYKLAGEKKRLKFVPEKAAWQGTKKFKIGFAREPLSVN